MNDDNTIDPSRRRFMVAATTVVGTAGIAAAAYPFIAYMSPSARARAAGAPVRVDISKLAEGQQITVIWQKKPVWILHRTADMLATLEQPTLIKRLRDPRSRVRSQQPPYAVNEYRSIKPRYLVAVALCTHLGCVPTFRPDKAPRDLGPDWPGGYYCPCHGSLYDLAGRVYKRMPAPRNLLIPPYRYLSDDVIEIGTHAET